MAVLDLPHPVLTAEQLAVFERDGYLHIPAQLLGLGPDPDDLQNWTEEIFHWPQETGKWMPYYEVNPHGKRLVMRTEKIVDYHQGVRELLCGQRVRSLLKQLTGKDMILFKDKVNYKLPGANGFVAHIDAPAYEHMGDLKFMEVMVVVDPQTPENGCLEFVPGSHKMEPKLANGGRLDPDWENSLEFSKLILNPGDIVIFGSRMAHRSGPNKTDKRRAAFFGTYHFEVHQPDLRERYFAHRREVFPPDNERQEGNEYKDGWKMFAYSSPFIKPGVFSPAAM